MILIYLLVLGLGAGTSVLALRLMKEQRRRRRRDDEHADRQQRIDHLADLVAGGERDAHFEPDVAARLHRFVAALREESRR